MYCPNRQGPRPDAMKKAARSGSKSGRGPCRFGQYNRFHRLVLDEMGLQQIPILAPDQDEDLYKELGGIGNGLSKIAWKGMVSIDLLQKKLRQVRPYEKNDGDSESLYRSYLDRVCRALSRREETGPLLSQAGTEFDRIPLNGAGRKPIIGIVGEIYIRSNRFSNEDLVRNLERLGCEVWLPPISEWLLYINYTSKQRTLRKKNYRSYVANLVTDEIQKLIERLLTASMSGSRRNGH